jgi:hypothetical protein
MGEVGFVGGWLVIAGCRVRGGEDEPPDAGLAGRIEQPEGLGDVDLERPERIGD